MSLDQAQFWQLRTRGMRSIDRSRLIQYALSLLTAAFVLAPILPILYQSFLDAPLYEAGAQATLANYANLVRNPQLGEVLVNSLIFAALTTLVAQFAGAALAILFIRTDMPGKRLLGPFLLWPMFVSSLVLAFGWFIVYGPAGYVTMWVRTLIGSEPWSLYSLGGMALIGGISQAPLTFLYCQGSISLADATLEDAARSAGARPMRVLFSITLPLLIPALVFSGILNFTVALETLAIPLIFGVPSGIRVFMTLLYSEGLTRLRPDYGLVSTAAVLLLLVVIMLIFLQNKLMHNSRRFVSVSGKSSHPRPLRLGSLRWPMFALVSAYVFFGVFLPVAMLVLRSIVSFLTPLVPFWNLWTLQHYTELFSHESYRRTILNTILVATIGGVLGTAFVAVLALVVQRSEFRFRRQLEYLTLFPRAVPGLVAGIGFFYASLILPPLGWLRNTVWILVAAYVMRYLPTGFGAISPVVLQIGPDIDRSARVMGADWWKASYAVLLPILKPALLSCFLLLFIQFFKEYTVAIFLFGPGSEVIGAALLQFWTQGEIGRVASMSTVQIALTLLLIYGAARLAKVKIYG